MLKSCPMCSRPFDEEVPAPAPEPESLMEKVLLMSDEDIDQELIKIILHSKSDSSKVTAEKRLSARRAERAEQQSDKGFPPPLTREEYIERARRFLEALGPAMIQEAMTRMDPNLGFSEEF